MKNTKSNKQHKQNQNQTRKNDKKAKHVFFLSNCVKYYQKHIYANYFANKNSFKNIYLEQGPIFIIDYPNIIHILHEKYNERNKVIECFYSFLHKQLTKNAKIIIIAKMVVIEASNIKYSISDVFSIGQKLTKLQIDSSFFNTQQILVFEFNYKHKISSSVDDLIGYFICVVLFAFLSKNEINPIEKDFNGIQKLNMVTNDMQQFNKNLFGLTIEEEQHGEKINVIEMNEKYKMIKHNKEQLCINTFMKEYMSTKSNDTQHLACLIIGLVNYILYDIKKIILSFNKFKTIVERKKNLCKKNMKISCVYLYVLIKCVQTKLFDENMFGSFSKDKIIEMFS